MGELWTVDSGQWAVDSGPCTVTVHRPLPTAHYSLPLSLAMACLLFISGCSWTPPPDFNLNTEGRDPRSIKDSQRASISRAMEKLFGTPDKPVAPDAVSLDGRLLAVAAGPVGSDEHGSPVGLYRKHCVACHGISGDGAGPNAAALMPYPRDYRLGIFKYTSTAGGGKPVRDDLLRTLRAGIPGTAMPSFGKLPREQLDALVEYVKYLSLRGETELYLLAQVVDEDEMLDPMSLETVVEEGVMPIAQAWDAAEKLRVTPPPPPPTDTPERLAASLARGRAIFLSTDAQCFRCHGRLGKGDGEQSARVRRLEQEEKRGHARRDPQAGRLFFLADRGASSAKFFGRHIPRRRSPSRSILSGIGRNQRHAHAARGS